MFELINKVKEINPLVLHYTNEVTINDCANITLARLRKVINGYNIYKDGTWIQYRRRWRVPPLLGTGICWIKRI